MKTPQYLIFDERYFYDEDASVCIDTCDDADEVRSIKGDYPAGSAVQKVKPTGEEPAVVEDDGEPVRLGDFV